MMIATILAGGLIAVLFMRGKLQSPMSGEPDKKLTPTQIRVLALHVEHASRFNI